MRLAAVALALGAVLALPFPAASFDGSAPPAAEQAPARAQGPQREALVCVAVANMYSAPDDTKDVVSQATLAQVVAILETQGGFARIRTPDAYEGWIPLPALTSATGAVDATRYGRSGNVAEVTSLMANIYREPDVTTARPKLQAPLATRLEIVSQGPVERWLAVRLPGGEEAYVQKGDVRLVDGTAARPRADGRAVAATARRFLGAPYLWGGMTVHGIDCSGLASRAYHANGIELPRDADLQFADPSATPVDRAQLLPGDLVFFGRDQAHITHVGIYDGEGRFLNATTHETPTVREDRLDDPYWQAIYQGARRPR